MSHHVQAEGLRSLATDGSEGPEAIGIRCVDMERRQGFGLRTGFDLRCLSGGGQGVFVPEVSIFRSPCQTGT